MASIRDIPDGDLRAMADCRAISSADYVDEVNRRAGRIQIDAPPLDYVLDDELDIPGLDVLDFGGEDDDGVPNPAPGAWLVFFFASTVIIAVALIWRTL